jgi:hypothetical protein
MTTWSAIVLALPELEGGTMASRLPSFLHPVAGRPLVWHTIQSLGAAELPPSEVLVIAPGEVTPELFEGAGIEVRTRSIDTLDEVTVESLELDSERVALIHASASLDRASLRRLAGAADGVWIEGSEGTAAAIAIPRETVGRTLVQLEPFAVASGLIDPGLCLPDTPGAFVVRNRSGLARAHHRIREGLIRNLMDAGATFILPDTVAVDVDVRIGRDTVVYPGVVIEGQTTIGEETVIGPGCRIIDSWVGSGVELKGWNYIAHTSVRNRAILEPYVRRGFN